MHRVSKPRWPLMLTCLHVYMLTCFLVGGSVAASAPPPSLHLSVSCGVGRQAVLPCSWRRRPGSVAPPVCHLQWATPDATVFELLGEARWEAPGYRGRLEAPGAALGGGDCSLAIKDAQIGDAGQYESFMVLEGPRGPQRVFIQSVRLAVHDHESQESRGPGEDLVLDLYTRHSERVVFQNRSGAPWAELWSRGGGGGERLVKRPQAEQLTLKELRLEDRGTYRVLDQHGRSVSTVQLAVGGSPPAASTLLAQQAPTGDGVRDGCSTFSFCLLLTSFIHLL